MEKTKNFISFLIVGFLTSAFVYSFEPIETGKLLISYLENDNDLKNNAINAQKAQLSLKATQITNGFDITLSTGNATVVINDDGTSFSIRPSVTATIPQASNLTLTASADYETESGISENKETKISGTGTQGTDPSTDFENIKFNASVDIISSNRLQRKISILKAERNLTEAKRKLQNQAIKSEMAFYSELRKLLTETSSIINLENNLYTNKIDFEKVKTQGYSSGSSTYRLAQMKVQSLEYEIKKSTRALIHNYVLFYKKCGFDISLDEKTVFYDLIPEDIDEVEPLDIHTFSQDSFTEIENALWKNYINGLERQAKSNFSLSANGGMTFFNSYTDSTTVDAGLSSVIGGIKLGTGVSVPIDQNPNPVISFSASVNPNTFRLNSISKKSDSLDEELELIEIENARSNYETTIVDFEQELEDLEWTKKSDFDAYEMYKSLENDLKNWFEEGFVSETEYNSAKINVQSYKVRQVINSIDYIIYNDNIITMFVNDAQENQEKFDEES